MEEYRLRIIIKNNTNNVGGGDSKIFGTWMYFQLRIDGVVYNVDNFKNIIIQNGANSAGHKGHNDVFITPIGSTETILERATSDDMTRLNFTFGTFYNTTPGIFPHTELLNTRNIRGSGLRDGLIINNRRLEHETRRRIINFTITISGTIGNNSADWKITTSHR